MDSNLMLFLFIILLVIVVFALIFALPSVKLCIEQMNAFKEVYSNDLDLSNFEIKVLNTSNEEIANIMEYNDIFDIVKKVAKTEIKGTEDPINGDSIKLKLVNKTKKTEFVILITTKQVKIDDNDKKQFKITNDLYDSLNKIISKYV